MSTRTCNWEQPTQPEPVQNVDGLSYATHMQHRILLSSDGESCGSNNRFLDYVNTVLVGISDFLITKLQRVQNSAARLVVHLSRWEHITPVLMQLHWLPVNQRIEYKILLLSFWAQRGVAPSYITNMLDAYRPACALRSANNNDLRVLPSTSRYGDRTFSVSAPRMWNNLPFKLKTATSLTTFKLPLKTHLFRVAFTV